MIDTEHIIMLIDNDEYTLGRATYWASQALASKKALTTQESTLDLCQHVGEAIVDLLRRHAEYNHGIDVSKGNRGDITAIIWGDLLGHIDRAEIGEAYMVRAREAYHWKKAQENQ